jgi:hypothetical protein
VADRGELAPVVHVVEGRDEDRVDLVVELGEDGLRHSGGLDATGAGVLVEQRQREGDDRQHRRHDSGCQQ